MRNYCYLEGTTHAIQLCFLNSLSQTGGFHNFYQELVTVFSFKVLASGIGSVPGVNREGFFVAGISHLPSCLMEGGPHTLEIPRRAGRTHGRTHRCPERCCPASMVQSSCPLPTATHHHCTAAVPPVRKRDGLQGLQKFN